MYLCMNARKEPTFFLQGAEMENLLYLYNLKKKKTKLRKSEEWSKNKNREVWEVRLKDL